MINEGTILILEQGSHEDHSFHGPYRVMRVIDEPKVFELYKEQWTAFAGHRPLHKMVGIKPIY
jgi:hypothetical protein